MKIVFKQFAGYLHLHYIIINIYIDTVKHILLFPNQHLVVQMKFREAKPLFFLAFTR